MKLSQVNVKLGTRLPRPQLGINMWRQGATAKVISQSVNTSGDVIDTVSTFTFDGVIQPLKPEHIQLKPQGQWSWSWYWFHTKENVQLETNDKVVYGGITYKIMDKKDYSDYGHIEYHCIKDFQDAN